MAGEQFELECEVLDNPNLWCEFTVEVTHFHYEPPSGSPASQCDCPDEYYGELECEWRYVGYTVTDQDGGEVGAGLGDPPYRLAMADEWITHHLADYFLENE